MARERVGKSGRNSGRFREGADTRRGKGPQKGAPNAGRPSSDFISECTSMSEDLIVPLLWEHLATHNPIDVGWRWAAGKVLAYAHGEPSEYLELNAPEFPVLVMRRETDVEWEERNEKVKEACRVRER